MRFMCLHGRGTNSDIFEAQLAPLISRISQDYEFDFIDGEVECKPAPEVDAFYPPPYLCYHFRHQTPYIQKAHEYLRTVIEEDGPYDGIIGFSQGAALAMSFLLTHQIESPHLRTPFRVAIFICSALPFSPSTRIGRDISYEFPELEARMARFLGIEGETNDDVSADDEAFSVRIFSSLASIVQVDGTNRKAGIQPRGLVPGHSDAQITIPTVHIIGKQDIWAEHSESVKASCQKDKIFTIYHSAGHELPKKEDELSECASLVELAISLSFMGC